MHGPIAYDVNRELSDYVDSLLPIVRVGAAIPKGRYSDIGYSYTRIP